MNILEIAKSITEEDIAKADEFFHWCYCQQEHREAVSREIAHIGLQLQSHVDVVFFLKWLEGRK